jgi:hypothetical protein
MENIKNIQFINLVYNWQPPNDFSISYLFYTNKLVQKHNENLFINTSSPTFIFEAMNINQLIVLLILQNFKLSKKNCRFAFYN